MHTRYKLDDSQINRTLSHLFVFTSWLHNGRGSSPKEGGFQSRVQKIPHDRSVNQKAMYFTRTSY
eukprot:scaffold161580_cov54-Cyclotella_meneghiniana.AAC.1